MFAVNGTPRSPRRKRRQASRPFLDSIFPDPPRPFTIRGLNYTDEQREFCNNIEECMFDLLFTDDKELAATTMDASMESARQRTELSKHLVATKHCSVTPPHSLAGFKYYCSES